MSSNTALVVVLVVLISSIQVVVVTWLVTHAVTKREGRAQFGPARLSQDRAA